MPLYEYECRVCKHPFEKIRPSSQRDEPTPCPSCESERTNRKLSVVAMRVSAGSDDVPCETSQAMGTTCCRTQFSGGG
jgi:putative FmdB family regulatory protein